MPGFGLRPRYVVHDDVQGFGLRPGYVVHDDVARVRTATRYVVQDDGARVRTATPVRGSGRRSGGSDPGGKGFDPIDDCLEAEGVHEIERVLAAGQLGVDDGVG